MLKFQNDWNSLKHPLVEYYKETSKILVFLPWKEVADPYHHSQDGLQNQTTLPKATIHFFIRNKKIYARAD